MHRAETALPAPRFRLKHAWLCLPPQNPYCCAKPATNGHPFKGTATGDVAAGDMGTNLYLVNGGYMPEISLQQDTWARIRLLYSGAKVRASKRATLQPTLHPCCSAPVA